MSTMENLSTRPTRELMEFIAGPAPGWGRKASDKILYGIIQHITGLSARQVRSAAAREESNRVRRAIEMAAQSKAVAAACARLDHKLAGDALYQAGLLDNLARRFPRP